MSDEVVSKVCTQCKVNKPLDEFYKKKGGKLGRTSKCSDCMKANKPTEEQRKRTNELANKRYANLSQEEKDRKNDKKKEWYVDNKDAVLERNREYHHANKEVINERRKQYTEDNREAISKQRKGFREDNKERLAEERKVRYEANKDEILATNAKYYEVNKDKVDAQRKLYREENKEEINKRKRQYRLDNPELIKEQSKARYKRNKEKILADTKQYRLDNPERGKAHDAVKNAISRGELYKPRVCTYCESTGPLEGHHWSYEEEHHLDVIWSCRHHHNDLHRYLRGNVETTIYTIDCSVQENLIIDDYTIGKVELINVDKSIIKCLTLNNLSLLKDYSWLDKLNLNKLTVDGTIYLTVEDIPLNLKSITLKDTPLITNVDTLLDNGVDVVCINCRNLDDYVGDDNIKVLTISTF